MQWQEYCPCIAVKMFRQHESGGTTLLAQYAPGSSFASHRHPGGEEICVIEGTLSDKGGESLAGSYLYGPPGSVHRTWSGHGCTVLVVLLELVGGAESYGSRRGWREGLFTLSRRIGES